MNTSALHTIRLTGIAAAVLAASAPALAAEGEDIALLTKPESSVSIGAGYLFDNGPRFGQYTGLQDRGWYGLLDLDYLTRNDATGTWLKFNGRNLGLDSRELRFEHNRQGNWGYFAEFSQIPRFDPFTVNTRLLGVGASTQTVNGLPSPVPQHLEVKRDRWTLGFDKLLGAGFDFQVRFRNEEKDGARLYGQGDNPGSPNTRFLTDPINYTMRQFEAILSYTGDRLQLSGGYYGTSFDNHIPGLNVVGGVAGFTPMALPPGNQSHQLNLAGGYSFTPTTRGTFKVAYTHATQNEGFVTPAAAGVGRTDLSGEVNTTLVQAGITARPLPKLSLLANFRYEDRDDRTPVATYFTGAAATSTLDGRNEPRSFTSTTGKGEASYTLPMGLRLTGGVDYELKKRNTFAVRSVSHRDETEEWSYRAELRRSISETVTGALAYVYSDRDGSPFLTTVVNNGTLGSNLVHPLHLADRKRDKVRASVNWMPAEPLTIQFMADISKDKYSGRALGPREGQAENYSIDAAYTFSEKWQATAWLSRNDARAEQATCVGASATGVCPNTVASPIWEAKLRNLGNSLGIGLRGKPYSWLDLGADVSYSDIKDVYEINSLTTPTSSPLPDIKTRLTNLKLFAKYALQKNSGIRLNYIYDHWRTNDWTWTTYVYGSPTTADGTTVTQPPVQKVHFIGVSYYYRWQ